MQLAILPNPDEVGSVSLANWLRSVGEGAVELMESAAADPNRDASLSSACAWLAADLGAICVALGRYCESGTFRIEESPPDGPERLEEMARLLTVGSDLFGAVSPERTFVTTAIRDRLAREMQRAPYDWVAANLRTP